MLFYNCTLIALLSCLCISVVEAQTIPYFHVLAPQFLCGSAKSESNLTDPKSITIAMQTRGSERLLYKVQITFIPLDGFKSQRHTLSVWRSIRMLEKKIRDTKDVISQKNQIELLNEELVAGVKYTFHIIGVDAEGNASPPQNFSVTYRGANEVGFAQDAGSSGSSSGISFLLVGTWQVYRDLIFLMQGVISFCEPTPFYTFHWTMTGVREADKKYLNTTSKTLLIPSESLQPGSSHEVVVEVKDKDKIIAKASGVLKVLVRPVQIQMVPNNITTGVNRKIVYQVFLDNYQATPTDNLTITWSCNSITAKAGKCQQEDEDEGKKEGNGNSFSTHFAFAKTGLYMVSVSVTINGGATKRDIAWVDVNSQIYAAVEVTSIKPFYVVAGDYFSALVRINFLIPKCTAEWISVNKSGYQFLNTSQLENGLGTMYLHDMEESFLSELIEFENDTTSYDLLLEIPARNKTFQGLAGNGVYLFRLVVECPELLDEDISGNQTDRIMIPSYIELVLKTNARPVVGELEISPRNGTAVKTLFKFTTSPAVDSPGDYPMRYRFFYQVNNIWVQVGDFYENTVVAAELPYSKAGIKTMFAVCDSRGACSQVSGPVVSVALGDQLSGSEIQMKLDLIKGSLLRSDYSEFFERSVALFSTIHHYHTQYQPKINAEGLMHKLILSKVDVVSAMFKSQDDYQSYMGKKVVKEWYVLSDLMGNMTLKEIFFDLLYPSESTVTLKA